MISHQKYQSAKILIVDNHIDDIMLLESMLQHEGFKDIHFTQDSTQVVSIFKNMNPDLLCLNIQMPRLNGFQIMGQLKIIQPNAYLPILVFATEDNQDLMRRALESGAKDFLHKPFKKIEVKIRIRNLLENNFLNKAMIREKENLNETIRIRTQELKETQLEIVHRLARAAEYRDNETGAHIVRMSHFAMVLGRAYGMSEEECDVIFQATPMHDVGKIGIPDKILLKPGKLDSEEFEIMKLHTIIGSQLLANSHSPVLKMAEVIALTHHEKWDGSGYPNCLSGEDIPLPGQICALADVFDALSSKRCYKEAWPLNKAVEEINRLSGKQFNPRLVNLFNELLPVFQNIQFTYSEMEVPKLELTPMSLTF